MKELEERIIKDGVILPGDILKVGSFLNQQMDSRLLKDMAKETLKYFPKGSITKVLTIEASGIAFATALAFEYDVPFVFAKKSVTSNVTGYLLTAKVESYTHGKVNTISVPESYINSDDLVLIADDFLANGNALRGLIEIVEAKGATVVGCVCEIEKVYQNGGNKLRASGYKVISLAGITEMTDDGKIKFN